VATITDKIFRNDMMVGYSMATVACISIPLALVFLRLALRPMRGAIAKTQGAADK
jgi:hypothetical protein